MSRSVERNLITAYLTGENVSQFFSSGNFGQVLTQKTQKLKEKLVQGFEDTHSQVVEKHGKAFARSLRYILFRMMRFFLTDPVKNRHLNALMPKKGNLSLC